MDFSKHFATRLRRLVTPQRERTPGTAQVPDSAGGYAWPVDEWARLDRFLILGSEGGTYYIGERALTRESARAVEACIAIDGARVVRRVLEVSEAGRAPKNDPALFVLAMAAGLGDARTRALALEALPRVARTGTHLFHWLRFVGAFRGWGRGVRRAVGRWYTEKGVDALAYQLLKYPQRDGWAHRDALRLAHPTAPTPAHAQLFRFAARGWEGWEGAVPLGLEGVPPLEAVRALRWAADSVRAAREAAELIRRNGLVREMIPTHLLRYPVVWEALLERMPLGALVRNLGVMSKVGVLTDGSENADRVAARLTDRDALRHARLHPLAILAALVTYRSGRGVRGQGSWTPVARIVDALDAAFYLAFANAPSTGRRLLLALDVSGSMSSPVHGLDFVSCREASGALALVTAATEPRHRFVAFTAGPYGSRWPNVGSGLTPLALSPRQRLDDVVRAVSNLPFGGTDCALPMVEALKHEWEVDAFVVYTDNETWAGSIHPVQALRAYRNAMGIPAKLIVVAMASNGFSIADPDDGGMLDVVGFDAAVPAVMAEFIG